MAKEKVAKIRVTHPFQPEISQIVKHTLFFHIGTAEQQLEATAEVSKRMPKQNLPSTCLIESSKTTVATIRTQNP